MKPAILKAAILETLSERDEPVPERYIKLALAVQYGIKVTLSDLKDALSKLEATKLIAGTSDHDDVIFWDISPAGKLKLGQLR
jgi:hypothetical protein